MRNIVGPPVRGEDFFPRPNEVDQIWKELDAGNNIILSGPMKSGKTSILLHLKDNPKLLYKVILIDIQSTPDEFVFFRDLLNELDFDGFKRIYEQYPDDKQETDAYKIAATSFLNYNKKIEKYVIIVDGFHQSLLDINNTERKRKILLLLKAIHRLVYEIDKTKNEFFFICSVTGKFTDEEMSSLSSFIEINITPFTKKESEDFLSILHQNDFFTFHDDVRNYILEKIGFLIPYYIQLFYNILMKLLEMKGIKEITHPVIDEVIEEIASDSKFFPEFFNRINRFQPFFMFSFDNLFNNLCENEDLERNEISTLSGEILSPVILYNAIDFLIFEGFLIRYSPRDRFRFSSTLLKTWWMKNKMPKNVKLELSSDESNSLKTIRVQRIIIRGIRCFEDTQINFDSTGNAGVIVGINGRGKSTILQLIALGLSSIKSVPFVYNWKNVVKTGNDIGGFELDAIYGDNPVQLKFEIDLHDDSIICKEGLDLLKSIKGKFLLLGYGVNRSIRLEEAKPYGDIEPFASLFGSNEYLKHIKISTNYESVKNNFTELKKFINRILEQSGGEGKVVLDRFDTQGFYFITPSNLSEPIPVEALSEGFKSTFVWLLDAILRIVEKGGRLENASQMTGIVLIDEIDLHLHPSWQRTILGSIQSLFPNIQFIVTTHSPFVAQGVRKESLIVLEMDKENNSVKTADKEITSDLSYTSMVREVFDIPFPFSPEIEKLMNHYREMELRLRKEEKIDEEEFKRLVVDIAGRGVELEGIMRREIMSLEKRIGRTFDLWKK